MSYLKVLLKRVCLSVCKHIVSGFFVLLLCFSLRSHHLGSIFDPLPDPNDIQVLSELQKDSRLDEWFTKKPNEHTTKKLKTKALDDAVATMENSKRVSVLGSAASQKYRKWNKLPVFLYFNISLLF